MRELEQCKAEVFRRSEKRILERKRKRRWVMAWCVPLVLCVAVCLTASGNRKKTAELEWVDSAAPKSGHVCDYQEVVIQDCQENSRSVTVPEEVTEIFDAISMLDPSIAAGHTQIEAVGTENFGQVVQGTDDGKTGCEITFLGPDGTQVLYVLEESVLYNVTWDAVIPLTQEQAAELRAALGIEE